MARKLKRDEDKLEIRDFYPDPVGFDNQDEHEALAEVRVEEVDEHDDHDVPEEGSVDNSVKPLDPDRAGAINKARLAHGDVDLVPAEPDPKPKPTPGMQPGPAEGDVNESAS